MQSVNPDINALHAAYCEIQGIELPLLPASERWWFDALRAGMTAEDVRLVLRYRRQRKAAGVRHEESMYLRNLIGSDEAIASTMEEAAAVRAGRRVKVVDKGKAEVLRTTGRPVQSEEQGVRAIGEVLEAMRKAAG